MSALPNALMRKGEAVNFGDEATRALKEDLRINWMAVMRDVDALRVLVPMKDEVIERLKQAGEELFAACEAGFPTGSGRSWSMTYTGLKAREAAILDLSIYGENRTIADIQKHVYDMGFDARRSGQIRSSINGKDNRDVFFKVAEGEKVTLTPKGRETGRLLKQRYGIA